MQRNYALPAMFHPDNFWYRQYRTIFRAAEFENLYNEACALEKQMQQEPESAETVCDEQTKEIEDRLLELYVKALYLYKGEFAGLA